MKTAPSTPVKEQAVSARFVKNDEVCLYPNQLHDPVNSSYRANGAWLFHDTTTATVRKLRDGAGGTQGQFIWQPSPTAGMIGGEPDRLLGYPCFCTTDIASMASDAKIGFFGDWSALYVRDVQGLRIERSDDIYFDKNQVALRGLMRIDSGLADSAAIVTLHQAVT